MKIYLLILICIPLTVEYSFSQTFPKEGKVISYFEVVELDSIEKVTGFRNALKWGKSLQEEHLVLIKTDSVEGSLAGHSSFLVYGQTGILKKVSGRISYSVFIDVKNNKYRYHFTDFVFHYYALDRNYKIEENGKTKKLEDPKATGWQQLWTKHRAYTIKKIAENIELLKKIMQERPVVILKEKAVAKKVEW
ncbi:hypothetical protein BH09BAC3_BH09BAC3_03170 [soil metagenome]